MATYNVPQYIDVEDKVAGPLTAKQLLWMFGMGAALLVLYNMFEFNVFAFLSVPVILIFCAFAFYRPYNMPLIAFVSYTLLFLVRPKLYVWIRDGRGKPHKAEPKPKQAEAKGKAMDGTPAPGAKKVVTLDQIADLTKILDQ